jgi:formylglycine-generating enzyme
MPTPRLCVLGLMGFSACFEAGCRADASGSSGTSGSGGNTDGGMDVPIGGDRDSGRSGEASGSGGGTAPATGDRSSVADAGSVRADESGTAYGGPGPSCAGLAATCGPSQNENCCTALLVPGGTFNRDDDPNYPATLSDFGLDKYEVTVGRFRAFVTAGMGTAASPPAAGAGAHPLIAGTGWEPSWNSSLPTDTASLQSALKCNSDYQTWTDTAGANENMPINCIGWYEAFAFCAWDGGRLATEAEWSYADVGGSEQREYPWGDDPMPDGNLCVCGCLANSGGGFSTCTFKDILPVGSKPAGNSKWGQSDLAGSMWEWVFDWYGTFDVPCVNCANTTAGSYRTLRGAGWQGSTPAPDVRGNSAAVSGLTAIGRFAVGVRCARNSL